jgi:hypothetical protein
MERCDITRAEAATFPTLLQSMKSDNKMAGAASFRGISVLLEKG